MLSEDSKVTGSQSNKLDIKIKKLETFKGDAKLVSTFLVSVSMYCGLQPYRFHPDHIKIQYVGSLFREITLQWWVVEFAKADKPIWMYDWQLFLQMLTDMFDPGDRNADAGKRIADLKQGKLVAGYYTRFMEAATETLWNKSAQIHDIKNGLKEPILNALALCDDKPRTLSALAALVIKIDQRLYDVGNKRDRSRTGMSAIPVTKVEDADPQRLVTSSFPQPFQNTVLKAIHSKFPVPRTINSPSRPPLPSLMG